MLQWTHYLYIIPQEEIEYIYLSAIANSEAKYFCNLISISSFFHMSFTDLFHSLQCIRLQFSPTNSSKWCIFKLIVLGPSGRLKMGSQSSFEFLLVTKLNYILLHLVNHNIHFLGAAWCYNLPNT